MVTPHHPPGQQYVVLYRMSPLHLSTLDSKYLLSTQIFTDVKIFPINKWKLVLIKLILIFHNYPLRKLRREYLPPCFHKPVPSTMRAPSLPLIFTNTPAIYERYAVLYMTMCYRNVVMVLTMQEHSCGLYEIASLLGEQKSNRAESDRS